MTKGYGTPELNPRDWALSTAARDDGRFDYRVQRCDSVKHLRAAVQREAERMYPTRQERIAAINQRIEEVRDAD
jgi:hypothetical protein